MPLEYRIDRTHALVWARAHGVLTPGEFFGYQRAIMGRPDITHLSQLVDVSAVTDILEPTPEHMRSLAQAAVAIDDPASEAKLALVASSDVLYGLGRQYETYRAMNPHSARPTRVFRTLEEACAFLGVEGLDWDACEPL